MTGWLVRKHICIVRSGMLNMRNLVVENLSKVKRAVSAIE